MVNQIIRFCKERWQAKLGSFLIAILFYFYVQYTKTITKTYYIKVETPVLPNHLVFNQEPPTFIKVEFSGPEELMDIEQSNFKLHLINTGPGPGLNKFRLELIPRPPVGIDTRMEPSEVELLLDLKKRKTLPLIPIYKLSSDKQVTYWNLKPIAIMVEGPEKLFDKLDRIRLNAVQLTSRSNLFYGKVLISNLPQFVRLVENQPFEIQVEMKYFSKEELEKKIHQIPDGYQSFQQELIVKCKNKIEKLEVENNPKVKITYISRYHLSKKVFSAISYCPVKYNMTTQTIEPGMLIPDLPVFIETRTTIKELEILQIQPLKVNFQFRIKKKPILNQLEKGLQEHLIR